MRRFIKMIFSSAVYRIRCSDVCIGVYNNVSLEVLTVYNSINIPKGIKNLIRKPLDINDHWIVIGSISG